MASTTVALKAVQWAVWLVERMVAMTVEMMVVRLVGTMVAPSVEKMAGYLEW